MDSYEVELECLLRVPGEVNCKQLSFSWRSDRRFDVLQRGVKIGQTQPFNRVNSTVRVRAYACGFGAMWKPEGRRLPPPTISLETESLTKSEAH